MPSYYTLTSGTTAQAQDVNQVINALNGAAGQGIPTSLTAVNDSVNFSLAVKNADATNSRALQVLRSNNNVLIQADVNGVIVSPDGGASTAQVVNTTLAQTLSNKTFTSPIINGATFDLPPMARLGQVAPLGSAAAQMDVASIPATYRHLLITWQGRSTTVAASTLLRARLNASSAAQYYGQRLTAAAATVSAGEDITGPPTSGRIGNVAAASASAILSGSGLILIPNYAQTTFGKQVLGLSFFLTALTTGTLNLNYDAFYWDSTAAVNEVTLILAAGNFDIGSTMTLYGLP